LAVVGGAPMPEELIRVWLARGIEIVQGYGLTEAAPNVLCLPPEDAIRKMGSAGKPYPYVEVRLGEDSELQVRGPNVFPGYWRNPEATAEVLSDGWLHTGDIAEVDGDGCYRIRGRLKDMYISGGENVYPAEVEGVLHEHSSVAHAAVVGVPDARWGEAGVAFVLAKEPVSEDVLLAHCRERLAKFKVPKRVRFVDALPMSAMNKVLKDELRALDAEGVPA
jgi:fatty-acyl-CoA synthase